jgi:hypothetical protein
MIRRVVRRLGFDLVPHPPPLPGDFPPEVAACWAAVRPYTATTPERVGSLWAATLYVVRNRVPGALVECGVFRGGSSMTMALALAHAGDTGRELYLFDTYQGMPPPTDVDRESGGKSAADALAANKAIYCYSPLDEVQRNMARTGYPADRIRYVPGKVEDTLPAHAPERIALLRLDTDWYESTRHELEHLYPRLAPGGVLVIDDYGHWEGARKAVDEYFAGRPHAPLLVRVDYTGRVAVKTDPGMA